jgi:hypothetical protein
MKIVSVVEGDGEVQALPVLLRRVAYQAEAFDIEIPHPIRVHRDRFLNRPEEFSRVVRLADSKALEGDLILILLDADDDCAAAVASDILNRASAIVPHKIVSAVLAVAEFEGWFVAAAESIAGHRGLPIGITSPPRPEEIRDAKGWLSDRMLNRYHEVSDQPALAQAFDFDAAAASSRSLRKLLKEVQSALQR